MAARANYVFWLAEISKNSSETTWPIELKFGENDEGIDLLQSFVGFFVYRKFKMATATGHSLHRTLWENFRTNKSTNSGINPVVVNKHAKIVFFN